MILLQIILLLKLSDILDFFHKYFAEFFNTGASGALCTHPYVLCNIQTPTRRLERVV